MTSPDVARRLRQSSVAVKGSDRGGGSGVIWSADGLIVTNAHVVRSRDPLVVFDNGREFQGEVIHHDHKRDLALLRIAAGELTPAVVGDSGSLRIGQLVTAIGNPLGMIGAVTAGVIYATGGKWIEASVRLAPGNSGGMLADSEGRVIGINTMIQYGLALAIPSNAVAAFVHEALISATQSRRTRAA